MSTALVAYQTIILGRMQLTKCSRDKEHDTTRPHEHGSDLGPPCTYFGTFKHAMAGMGEAQLPAALVRLLTDVEVERM